MKKLARGEVYARLEQQLRAGLEVLDYVRELEKRAEIKGYSVRVLSSDPFVVESIEVER